MHSLPFCYASLVLLAAALLPVDGLSLTRPASSRSSHHTDHTSSSSAHRLLIDNKNEARSERISPCFHCRHNHNRLFMMPPSAMDELDNDVRGASPNKNSGPSHQHYDAVIVGGGPAGLLSAIMMARHLTKNRVSSSQSQQMEERQQRPARIVVFDRLSPPPPPTDLVYSTQLSKYYLLGLGHRGQRALKHFEVWDDVELHSVEVLGRRGWSPGKTGEEDGIVTLAKKSVNSRILPRDKLVGVLKQVIEQRYGDVVELRYGWQVDPISFGNEGGLDDYGVGGDGLPVTLQISRCTTVTPEIPNDIEECSIEADDDDDGYIIPTILSTDFLIGSDGAARTVANAIEANDAKRLKSHNKNNPLRRLFGKRRPFRVKRYDDDNPRVYKSVPISFPKHWPVNLNYSARSTKDKDTGRSVTFEALPSDTDGNYCALLLMDPDDPLASPNPEPAALRAYFDEEFPQFGALLADDVLSDVSSKGASPLPGFRYAGPRLHEGGRTVLLGDAVHTVKPYFGLGANSALEDVRILSEILSDGTYHATKSDEDGAGYGDAVREFTNRRAADCKALVTMQRSMDRPGRLGTMCFVLPLILDTTFHKLLPKVFGPNLFGMFQLENFGFRQIQRRKRRDRTLQGLAIASGLTSLGLVARWFVKTLVRLCMA